VYDGDERTSFLAPWVYLYRHARYDHGIDRYDLKAGRRTVLLVQQLLPGHGAVAELLAKRGRTANRQGMQPTTHVS